MYVIVPVIYPLRLTSIHEYIQIRFNSPNLQVLLTLLVLVNSNVFIGVCLYGTTIVLTAVTPFNYTTCILVMGVNMGSSRYFY
ncbi:Sodium-dependent multivitamin transporter, partial [Armadillidium vulgare]